MRRILFHECILLNLKGSRLDKCNNEFYNKSLEIYYLCIDYVINLTLANANYQIIKMQL